MPTGLNVGVDGAKDTVVVASAEQRWPVPQVRNQRRAVRAWVKTCPMPGAALGSNRPARIMSCWPIWRMPMAISSIS